ncbi:MAG: hypothetical protein K0U78_14890 [Actinomycetia bacterium]|nr:hypothetical protein [Actinomycetes bacterium]
MYKVTCKNCKEDKLYKDRLGFATDKCDSCGSVEFGLREYKLLTKIEEATLGLSKYLEMELLNVRIEQCGKDENRLWVYSEPLPEYPEMSYCIEMFKDGMIMDEYFKAVAESLVFKMARKLYLRED